jgi:hypothetical protein
VAYKTSVRTFLSSQLKLNYLIVKGCDLISKKDTIVKYAGCSQMNLLISWGDLWMTVLNTHHYISLKRLVDGWFCDHLVTKKEISSMTLQYSLQHNRYRNSGYFLQKIFSDVGH